MNNKIKCAVIGCGRISLKHFEAIDKHQDSLELVAICDARSELAKRVAIEKKCKAYDTLPTLLKQSDAELIILCTLSGLHACQTVLCTEAGKHVMTEKPMATRWKDGLKMVKACDNAGVELFVVKQNRRNTTLQLLKNAVEKKRFGKIYYGASERFLVSSTGIL